MFLIKFEELQETLTPDAIATIRGVEETLITTTHPLRKLASRACLAAEASPDYQLTIYHEFVYPLYLYMDYLNNFLTIEGCSSYYAHDTIGITRELVERGKRILELINS